MSQRKVSSYRSHPREYLPLSLTIMLPHVHQGILAIPASSWSSVLIQFVLHALSDIDLVSQLAEWNPINGDPPLFVASEAKNYYRMKPGLYMFKYSYSSASRVQMCLDGLVDQLGLSRDCYEIDLEHEKKRKKRKAKEEKMSIYAFKGVNGW